LGIQGQDRDDDPGAEDIGEDDEQDGIELFGVQRNLDGANGMRGSGK
jgi:hypothetical protein